MCGYSSARDYDRTKADLAQSGMRERLSLRKRFQQLSPSVASEAVPPATVGCAGCATSKTVLG